MVKNAKETAAPEIIAVRSNPSIVSSSSTRTALASHGPCRDQLWDAKVGKFVDQATELPCQGHLAKPDLPFHEIVSSFLPYLEKLGGLLPNFRSIIESRPQRLAHCGLGSLALRAFSGRTKRIPAHYGARGKQANGPSNGVSEHRGPEWEVEHLGHANPGSAKEDREKYNRHQHSCLNLIPYQLKRSCPVMAKLGQPRDQTASSSPFATCLRAFVLLVFAAFLPGRAAEAQPPGLTPMLFLPGDICGSGADGSPASDLASSLDLAEFTLRPESALGQAEPSLTDFLSDAGGKAATDSAMSHDVVADAENPAMAREHAALLALVPPADATDVAIAEGSWFAATTWNSGRVPGPAAKVLIPSDISVTYDGQSDDPLFSLRVDGALRFATDRDSRMIIDTLVVAPGGTLEIGTASDPVKPNVQAEILITGDGDIDLLWDPMLLSRGVISQGKVEIHGARKTAFLKVGKAPKRGDRHLALASAPEGWRVGDRLIVTGTVKQGWAWDNEASEVRHHPSQDEIVTIIALDGAQVSIDRPLRFNHYAPRADLAAYVANTTRNIAFASLEGAETMISQRGHVMFMHSDAVDVRYAAFDHLGRTDKSVEAFDLGALAEVRPTSNIKGRYPLHLHKTGMARQEAPAMVVGNSVFESPGWGFVHHSSHVDLVDNVAFDVFGAAYAAEDGDETGIWLRNIAIRAQGFAWGDWSAKTGIERHDNGRTGDGFFFAGRLVEAAENVAANTSHGFVWMHRSAPSGPLAETIHQPEVAYGKASITPDDPPIQGFRNNEAFGTELGLIVIKSNSEQGHDVRSVLDGFLNWETKGGVDISYTGHYTFLNLDLVGTAQKGFFVSETGFNFGTNAFDIVINRIKLERFQVGISMVQGHTYHIPESDVGYVIIDLQTKAVTQELEGFSSSRHRLLTAADLTDGTVEVVQQPVEIEANEDLTLWASKHDSLGQTARQKAGDGQTIYRWDLPDLLSANGFRTGPDHRKVVLIPDFLADRATGALIKHSYLVTLNIPDWQLQSWGVADRGVYDPQNAAPVAVDDHFATTVGQALIIDPIANDTDPEGDAIAVQGTTDPRHGDLVRLEDGQLLYRPNLGSFGEDEFNYWAYDGAGNYTPATVRITVAMP